MQCLAFFLATLNNILLYVEQIESKTLLEVRQNEQIQWARSQVTNINCGGVKIASAGVVEYKYEEFYDPGERCIWTIQTTHNSIGLNLIASDFDNRARVTVYGVSSDGQPVPLANLTQSSEVIEKFPGPLLFLVFSVSGRAASEVTTPFPVSEVSEIASEIPSELPISELPESTLSEFPSESTPDPCEWWKPCITDPTAITDQTTQDISTITTTPPPSSGSGKGFLLSFRGDDGTAPTDKTYKHMIMDSSTPDFKYPESGNFYPANQLLSIILTSTYERKLSVTVGSVILPSDDGENFCGNDVLKILGPSESNFETRLGYCNSDHNTNATITTSKQLLLLFNSVQTELSGRGGFTLSTANSL